MDLFDDILPGAPTARSRPGGKFVPKVKSKKPPRKEISASEHATPPTSNDSEGISQNECHNAADAYPLQVELQTTEDAMNSELGNSKQVGVDKDTAPLVNDLPFMTAVSEVAADQNFTSFPKSASGADSVGFEVGSVTKSIPEIDLNNGTTQPVHPANAVEGELNNVAAPSTTCSAIGGMEELPKYGEGSFLDSNKSLEVLDSPNVGFKSASDENNTAISENSIHSNFDFGKEREVLSAEFQLHPFNNILLDPGPGTRNAHKFLPKIKPRPRLGNTPAVASASSNVMMEKSAELPTCSNEVQSFQSIGGIGDKPNQSTSVPLPTSEIIRTTDLSNKFDYMNSSIPFSEDNRSLAALIPSQPNSEPVAHNGTRDWPSSFDILLGLDSLDDFLTQDATGTDSLTFNKDGVVNKDDSRTNDCRSETQEVAAWNHDSLVDNVFHCQSLKFVTDPTSEVPMHEKLTNSADSPTLADFLHQNVTGEKEDANERKKNLRKHVRSSITIAEDEGGKTSRLLRKRAARKRTNNPLNEDVEDDDDLNPPYNSNRASTSSKKKYVAKTGKTSKKRKKANDDSDKITKEPPKKFSHSTQQRKRCVDKALLEDDELDYRTLSIRNVILLADYKERLAKKEATTSKNLSRIEEDGRDPDDDHASERITSTPLFNYQSFMDKSPRGKWSKQDTELFYEAVRQIGIDFSIIQQLFPDKTRHQLKLKYKKEERQHPLLLSDAFNNRATDYSHFKSVIAKLQQASSKAELTPGTNEEVGTAKQEKIATAKQDDADVKDQEDFSAFCSPEQSDDSDDELQRWSQYKSDF